MANGQKQRRNGEAVRAGGGITGYRRAIRRKWAVLAGLFAAMLFFMILSVNAGSAAISPWEVLKTVAGAGDERGFVVVWRIRMPRVVAAVVAGAAFRLPAA